MWLLFSAEHCCCCSSVLWWVLCTLLWGLNALLFFGAPQYSTLLMGPSYCMAFIMCIVAVLI